MSVIDDVLSFAGAVGRFFGLSPGPKLKRLKGPAHVYPDPDSIHARYGGLHRCLWCARFDYDEVPLTDPPCPRRLPKTVELA